MKTPKLFIISVLILLFAGLKTEIFAQCGCISASNMNILYVGVDNPLCIAISGVPAEKMLVTVSQGTISKVSECEYIVKPKIAGVAKIVVYAEINGLMYTQEMHFRVRLIPMPIAKVAGKSGGSIEKEVLLEQLGVTADLEDFVFDVRYRITQFTITVFYQESEIAMNSKSARFTEGQKELLSSLNRGGIVIFTDIKASGPDGVRNLSDFAIKIK